MSQILAKIAFYDIIKCGYYNKNDRKHGFCTIHEALDGLQAWVCDKSVGETVTFSPTEDSQQNKIYCYDMCYADHSAVLITWNGYETGEGNSVSAINGRLPIGNADIRKTSFSEEYIPGFETYFWFPGGEKNVFATVRFERQANAREDMCSYIEGFLAWKHPSYVFTSSDDDKMICYGRDCSDSGEYIPFFAAKPARLPGKIQQIKNLQPQIRKLRVQAELRPRVSANDKSLWQTLLGRVGLASPSVREYPIRYDTTFGWTPTREELDTIIEAWMNKSFDAERIGVIIQGDAATHWFDKCYAKTKIPIDIERNSQGVFSAHSLLESLNKNKERIFALSYTE